MRHRGVTRCAKRLCTFAHLFIYVRIAQLFMRHTVLRSSRMRWCNPLLTLALAVLGCVVGVYPPLRAQANAKWTIKGVLGMMDKSAQDFHTLTADLEHVKYTAVVKDTSTETGHIFVRRDEKMRIEIAKPDPRTILRTGDNLFVFNPKINRVEEYNLGKNRIGRPSDGFCPGCKSTASRNTTWAKTVRWSTNTSCWASAPRAKTSR